MIISNYIQIPDKNKTDFKAVKALLKTESQNHAGAQKAFLDATIALNGASIWQNDLLGKISYEEVENPAQLCRDLEKVDALLEETKARVEQTRVNLQTAFQRLIEAEESFLAQKESYKHRILRQKVTQFERCQAALQKQPPSSISRKRSDSPQPLRRKETAVSLFLQKDGSRTIEETIPDFFNEEDLLLNPSDLPRTESNLLLQDLEKCKGVLENGHLNSASDLQQAALQKKALLQTISTLCPSHYRLFDRDFEKAMSSGIQEISSQIVKDPSRYHLLKPHIVRVREREDLKPGLEKYKIQFTACYNKLFDKLCLQKITPPLPLKVNVTMTLTYHQASRRLTQNILWKTLS